MGILRFAVMWFKKRLYNLWPFFFLLPARPRACGRVQQISLFKPFSRLQGREGRLGAI